MLCRRIGNDQVEVLANAATECVRNGHTARTPQGVLTNRQLSYKISYMRKATNISIRELQQNLKGVIARVERGQIVEVTRHRRPVARLEPMRPSGAVPPWPDLDARARAVFGNRLVMPSPSDGVIEDRGER
jgi:prevent-host-death family protein